MSTKKEKKNKTKTHLLELIIKYNKIVEYKIKTQNLVVFLHTIN